MKSESTVNSKLLWALVAAVIVGAIYWGARLLGGSQTADDAELKDLPKKPANLQPVTEQEKAAVPAPVDLK